MSEMIRMMQVDPKTNNNFIVYENPDEMMNDVAHPLVKPFVRERIGGNSEAFSSRVFSKVEEVYECLNYPWEEGRAIVDQMITQIKSCVPEIVIGTRRKPHWNAQEGETCTDRMLSGDPNYMLTYRKPQTSSTVDSSIKQVVLMLPIGANGYVTPQDMFWTAAAGIAVADMLEHAGYTCEIWKYEVMKAQSSDFGDMSSSVKLLFDALCLKRQGEVLDIDRTVSLLSPWFYRTVNFAIESLTNTYHPGRCACSALNASSYYHLLGINEDAVHVLEMPTKVYDQQKAVTAAKNMLTGFQELNQRTVAETCAIDAADRRSRMTGEEIAALLGLDMNENNPPTGEEWKPEGWQPGDDDEMTD